MSEKYITIKGQSEEYVFELVNEVPLGYTVWNIGCKSNGGHMTDGYLPLCRLKRDQPFEGGREIEVDTLKAIKIEGADKVMEAFIRGINTQKKMMRYVKKFWDVNDSAIRKNVAICGAAINVMQKLNWEGEKEGTFKVKFESDLGGDDYVMEFNSEEEAEQEINISAISWVDTHCRSSQPGDIWHTDSGIQVDCWVSGSDQYATWKRLWKRKEGHNATKRLPLLGN